MQKAFSEPAVLNWDRVIHKNARTKDGEPLGYIASEYDGFILILSSGSREYRIPKSHVEAFDGSQVFLDLEFGEVSLDIIVGLFFSILPFLFAGSGKRPYCVRAGLSFLFRLDSLAA